MSTPPATMSAPHVSIKSWKHKLTFPILTDMPEYTPSASRTPAEPKMINICENEFLLSYIHSIHPPILPPPSARHARPALHSNRLPKNPPIK